MMTLPRTEHPRQKNGQNPAFEECKLPLCFGSAVPYANFHSPAGRFRVFDDSSMTEWIIRRYLGLEKRGISEAKAANQFTARLALARTRAGQSRIPVTRFRKPLAS
jgi:hypothetical protein